MTSQQEVEGFAGDGGRRADIAAALEAFYEEVRLRRRAPDPDIRVARVEVYEVMSVDLSELAAGHDDKGILQKLRALDGLFDLLKSALKGEESPNDWVEDASEIRARMADAVALRGKAVWTELFLDRYAPMRRSTKPQFERGATTLVSGARMSFDTNAPLYGVIYHSSDLRMFRDGILTYTVCAQLDSDLPASPAVGGHRAPPNSIRRTIEQLEALSGAVADNFRRTLAAFVGSRVVRERIETHLKLGECEGESGGRGVQLVDASAIWDLEALKRRGKAHTVVFVEKFYDGAQVDMLRKAEESSGSTNGGTSDGPVPIELEKVIASSSLAGILNTANWYRDYNNRYVRRLAAKEIGYKCNEIYLTDRKATVASAEGFWNERDSLSKYKLDVVLAVEYNMAILAYLSSTEEYYQRHPDVRNLIGAEPLMALQHAMDGRSVLSLLNESLDVSLLIDHGFTRELVGRLRNEFEFGSTLGFIQQRVEDTATSVALRSSVIAAEQTSPEALRAGLENNALQRTIRKWARIAVGVAIALGAISLGYTYWSTRGRDGVSVPELCVASESSGTVIRECKNSERVPDTTAELAPNGGPRGG